MVIYNRAKDFPCLYHRDLHRVQCFSPPQAGSPSAVKGEEQEVRVAPMLRALPPPAPSRGLCANMCTQSSEPLLHCLLILYSCAEIVISVDME